MKRLLTLTLMFSAIFTTLHAEDAPVWSDERGTWTHTVESPHQAGPTTVEILLPDKYDKEKRYPVVYLLPVEANGGTKFGDGIKMARQQGLHNRHDVIFAAPTFTATPWFANHPTDPKIRQEDYLIETVIPLVEKNYSTPATAEGRWLLGFSKSGWGALTLILLHPEVFGYAASWDAPLMMTEEQFGVWGTADDFGTAENMAKYLPSKLLETHAGPFRERERLIISGSNKFGTFSDKKFPYVGAPHTEAFHELAEKNGVKHFYEPGINFTHAWAHKWMNPLVAKLAELAKLPNKP